MLAPLKLQDESTPVSAGYRTACAKEGEADYIVSGDQDLLTLTSYEGIPIVTPAAFAALLKASR